MRSRVGLYTPRVDDKRAESADAALPRPAKQQDQPPPAAEDCNKENSVPNGQPAEDVADGKDEDEEDDSPPQIIPWRAQLRKTNSTLSLLE